MARMARIVDELRSLEPHGVGEKTIQKLIDSGVAGLSHLLEMTAADLTTLEGIGDKTADKILEAAAVAKVEWDRRDALAEAERAEAERVEEERLAAEQAAAAAEAEAAEAEAAEREASVAAGGPPPDGPEGEPLPAAAESSEGGETDG
jgi:NAD-dependent DNA ligase